jgi:cellulose synthase/poly-beta-1,6-N-acetylglucosamine synthase-like glycosyltransferase/exo-beta-1,3-glucanase (GH17 family)
MFRFKALFALAIVVVVNFGGWYLLNRPVAQRSWDGMIASVSFTPYQADQGPHDKKYPSVDQIDHDMSLVSRIADGVRTYDALNGFEKIPSIAAKYGLNVIAGAAVNGNKDGPNHDDMELSSLIDEWKHNKDVKALIVGNEQILTNSMTADQLIAMIKHVREATRRRPVPVFTCDNSTAWLNHPDLVAASDFICVHILPYHDSIPVDQAIDQIFKVRQILADKYPSKPIFLGEVGWPSEGPWNGGAEPSRVNEATFIRNFLNRARDEGLDESIKGVPGYNVIEAFDQPWKRADESTGGSWGLFDAQRHSKFGMSGTLVEIRNWKQLCGYATLLAMPIMLWFVGRRRDINAGGLIFFPMLIQATASLLVWTWMQITQGAYDPTLQIVWYIMISMQVVLFAVILSDGLEITELLFRSSWRRVIKPQRGQSMPSGPKVSIHVPCYNEPPHMVIETLEHLARLEYGNFEVLVIDNNTKDEAVWKPLEAYCATLDERFRFFHLANWPGFKAGALNFALKESAPDTQIVAVIDSDYTVDPDWLSAMVPHFANAKVGLVQSPQDYRDWKGDLFKTMCNWEYAGFFNIGMITRNERNAIIQHGTMTMMRRSALEQAGGWAEWCITEDADLGLTFFEQGWEALYAPDSFGRGFIPDSFSAYKTQRHRWAYGAVQIMKHHWRNFLPGSKVLTPGQRYHFVAGWIPWFADAAHLLFSAASVVWSLGMLVLPVMEWVGVHLWGMDYKIDHPTYAHVRQLIGERFGFPPMAFMIPTILAFSFKLIAGFWVYSLRIKCSRLEKIGAAIAGMALTHTVGRAILQGIFTSGRPFVRTPKCADQPALMQGFIMARDEIFWMVALIGVAVAVLWHFTLQNQEALIWSTAVLVQALPFVAAFITSMCNALPNMFKTGGNTAPVPSSAVPDSSVASAAE